MLDKDIDRFSARFGLTAAEIRVLGEIIEGSGLLAAAARLNISETTARTHISRIFDKTGTHRQTELIHSFYESASAGVPHDS